MPLDNLRAQFLANLTIARRLFGLTVQGGQLLRQIFDHIIDAQQVLFGTRQFQLCFVPPRTQNTWEHIYVPEFKRDKKFVESATKGPWDVHTQLYIDGEMVMHTKAQMQFK